MEMLFNHSRKTVQWEKRAEFLGLHITHPTEIMAVYPCNSSGQELCLLYSFDKNFGGRAIFHSYFCMIL